LEIDGNGGRENSDFLGNAAAQKAWSRKCRAVT
jgi:hypothetical protein